MVKLDYKKEYKDLYMPKGIPTFIDVPPIAYVMVEGKGNPISQWVILIMLFHH